MTPLDRAKELMLSLYPHTPIDKWGDDEHENCRKIAKALTSEYERGLERGAVIIEKLIEHDNNCSSCAGYSNIAKAIRSEIGGKK